MNKKDLIVALCKKNDFDFIEPEFLDITKNEYFQIAFNSPDEEKINSMNDVNKFVNFIEMIIDESEKIYKKKFNDRIFMIKDSLLVFGEWKELEKV